MNMTFKITRLKTIIPCLLIALFCMNGECEGSIKDLGVGQTQEKRRSFAYGEAKIPDGYGGFTTKKTFVAGTSPNGHIYTIDDPVHGANLEIRDAGLVLESYRETHIWTMCSDENGIIYGATSENTNETASIFRFDLNSNDGMFNPAEDPNDALIILSEFGLTGETFIFSSTNTPDYVYFGTFPGGKLIRYNKSNRTVEDIATPFSKAVVSSDFPSIYDKIVATMPDYKGESYIRSLATGPQGKIYGGTEHGFVFEYDPNTGQIQTLNANTEVGSSFLGMLTYMAGNENAVFGGISGSDDIQTFRLDFNSQNRVEKLWFESSLVPSNHMVVANNFLYVKSGYKYDIATRMSYKFDYKGDYVPLEYDDTGEPKGLGVLYNDSNSTLYFAYHEFANLNTLYINKSFERNEPDPKVMPSGGAAVLSIAADDQYVYGGTFFTGNFLRHRQSEDFATGASVGDMGVCGGAYSLIEDGGFIYSGVNDMQIMIYDPQLNMAELKAENGNSGEYPSADKNPLIRSLETDAFGSTIADKKLARATCLTSDKANRRLFLGTGPSTIETSGEDAWIIALDLPVGNVKHIGSLSAIGSSSIILKITDIAYASNHLFVLGESENKVLIVNVANLDNPVIAHEESLSASRIFIDESSGKIYLAISDVSNGIYNLRVYSLPDVITNGFSIAPQSVLDIPYITDIIKGNDDLVYMSYQTNRLGRLNSENVFSSVGEVNSANPHQNAKVYCLAASADRRNKNLYLGASDGSMYVFYGNASQILQPVPGSRLDSESATFVWENTLADQYWLRIGTSGPGSSDICSNSLGTETSETVSGLPTNGETLYVRLSSYSVGEWQHNDYLYRAFSLTEASLSNGLVGYWEFNEADGNIAHDGTGNGHDGAILNASGAAWERSDGICESGLDLTGGENYVTIPDDGSLSITGNLTVAAWVKPNGPNSCLVHKTADIGQQRLNYELGTHRSGFVFKMGNSADGTDFVLYSTSAPIAGRWYHVAGSYDGERMLIFVDGVLENSRHTGRFTPYAGPADLLLGSDRSGAYSSDAVVDNVRIYNRAISGAEIRTLFDLNRPFLYVDAANAGIETGTPEAPYNTIGEAVFHATDHSTIRVAKGSYIENVTISNTAGIRIESGWNNNSGVWIRDNPVNPNNTRIFAGTAPVSVRIENASGIVVEGFTIFGTGTGILVSDSNDVTLILNIVHVTASEPDAAGIKYFRSGGLMTKNRIHTVNPNNPAYCIVLEDIPESEDIDIETNSLYPQSHQKEVCILEIGPNATPRRLLRNEFYTDGDTVLYHDENGMGDIAEVSDINNHMDDRRFKGGNFYKRVDPYKGCEFVLMTEDSFDMRLVKGWNLISIPVVPNEKKKLSGLFPEAEIAYGYNGSEHILADELFPGQGYWVKMSEAKTYTLKGWRYFGVVETLSPGWHLKGAGFGAVSPKAIPENAMKIMFKYVDGKYAIAETLDPGEGFWVNILAPCEFDMRTEQPPISPSDH